MIQLSYAAVRGVGLTSGLTPYDKMEAQQSAVPGSLPTNWASTFLALKPDGPITLTDPKTGVAISLAAGEIIYGNDALHMLIGGASTVGLAYYAQNDKDGGPAKVL